MSTLDGPHSLDSDSGEDAEEGPTVIERLPDVSPVRIFERAAFWTAVALPFLYVPLLFGGISTSSEFAALVVLFGVNFVALYIGHDYEPN